MPEIRFVVRWPDGARQTCYSPSTIIREYFVSGTAYPVAEFVARSQAGLTAASERVRVVRGFRCSLAMQQLARIEAAAGGHEPDALVEFESFEDTAR